MLVSSVAAAQPAVQAPAPAGEGAIASSIPMPSIPVPDAGAPFVDFSKAWPARLPLGKDGRFTIAIGQPNLVWDFRQMRFGPLLPRAEDEADAAAVLKAAGVAFEPQRIEQAARFEGRGSFVARFEEGVRRSLAKRTRGLENFEIATLSPGKEAGETPSLERTWFTFYAPVASKGSEAAGPIAPHGIALVMPGIFGTPEGTLEGLVASLRGRGWHVLRMLAQPSRFTQTVTFSIDPAASDEAIDALGVEIAEALTGRAAECAYAVQGAFAHVMEEHPALAGLPRVAVGFSGGAITLPIVVAREPDEYSACVLVGGGAHYWLVNAHSTYADMIAAIKVEWKAPPTLEQRRRVAEAYLRHAPLDSFHTAAALRGKPMLMIQANADSAVAAVLGDVLWERLGKPERWIRLGEHLPLFIGLTKEFPAINDWIDGHVAATSPAGGDKVPAMRGKAPSMPALKEPK
jgi:hypothetical protein